MKLDTMMLANYAEDQGGLLYIMGGGIDTLNIQAPLEEAPDNVFALFRGTLVVRVLFHQTETNRDHTFEISIMDSDGNQIAGVTGEMHVGKIAGLPPGWDQNVNIVVPLTGVPLPSPGNYIINFQLNGQFLGDRPFRVLKLY